jgi:GntR family transcriptional regulator
MEWGLQIDPGDAAPIWRQIEEGVRRLVARGALAAGGPVPSVRDLARELRVNPATVAKAYQRLTDAGVLAVRRGEGTYVADSPPPFSTEERRRELHEGAVRYVTLGVSIGAGRDEAVDEVAGVWTSFEDRARGGRK